MNRSFTSKTISASILLLALSFMLTDISAQIVIAQWNGFVQGNPPANGEFLTTAGIALNKSAVLTRDVAGGNFAVNADGVAASQRWNDATSQEKYWIATFNTTGYKNLKVSSKQRSSDTGPKDFKLQYRTGTGSWINVTGAETIVVANDNYLTGVVEDLPLPVAMEDQTSVSLRWICTSTVAINSPNPVAQGGVSRLDVVITGEAKSGVVEPGIIVSKNNLTFSSKNQEESFTVSGENLISPINITSSNLLFLPDVASLPANASERVVTIMFTGSGNIKATLTLSSENAWDKVITLTANLGNDGSENAPFTAAESQANQGAAGNTDYYWVQGYIIGTSSAAGGSAYSPEFQPGTFTSSSNILIANLPDETNKANVVPVQLVAQTATRAGLNLINNPNNYGKYVKIEGTLEPYYGMPGLKNARGYEFITPPDIEKPPLPSGNIPIGYYNPIDGKQERELKTALHKILKEHTVLRYNNLWYYFRTTDVKPGGVVWDMYSDTKRYYEPPVNSNNTVADMDREHSLPKSWWDESPANEKYNAYSDLNHLCPSDKSANIAKSNNILGETGSSLSFNNGVTKVGTNVFPGGPSQKAFEPADEYKGDFARMYMYMLTCYEDYAQQWRSESLSMFNKETYPAFQEWTKKMLLKWHRNDPVSEKELMRNKEVYRYQNNRNPFIDFPQLAEYIWGDSVSYTFKVPEEYYAKIPVLITPVNLTDLYFGETGEKSEISQKIILKGLYLTENVSITLWSGDKEYFSIASVSAPANAVNSEEGYELTIVYHPQTYGEHNTALIIRDGGMDGGTIVYLKGVCCEECTDETGTIPVGAQSPDLYVQNDMVNFRSYTAGDKIFIRDALGRILCMESGSGNWQTFKCPQPGIYIIRLNRKNHKITANF